MDQIWIVSRQDETERDSWPVAAFAHEAAARACAAAEDLKRRRELLAEQRVEAGLAAWRAANPDPTLALRRTPDGVSLRRLTDAEHAPFVAWSTALQAERERLQALETAAARCVPADDLPPLPEPLHHVSTLPFVG